MIEQLICKACGAKLNRVNMKKLKHVVIKCPECGEVNDYAYDPTQYVAKGSGKEPSHPLDTLKSSQHPS
jgi:phage FluMu protein Com